VILLREMMKRWRAKQASETPIEQPAALAAPSSLPTAHIRPQIIPMRRSFSRYAEVGVRFQKGHKSTQRKRLFFPQGAGAHDYKYKDVRRGHARVKRCRYVWAA